MTLVKICGLTTRETLDAAVAAGADYVGFVHFERSPRHLPLDVIADFLGRTAPIDTIDTSDSPNDIVDPSRTTRSTPLRVVLLVDSTPALLAEVAALGPDLIQLHGRESPETVAAARAYAPVIKALPIADAQDFAAAARYSLADHLMFDAKPPSGSARPGGHGAAFDWSLLSALPPQRTPWFLAGGLTPANVAEALRLTRAPVADVSSGVERAPGVKDPALIAAFIQAVRAHDARSRRQQEPN